MIIIIISPGSRPPAAHALSRSADVLPPAGPEMGRLHRFHTQSSDKEEKISWSTVMCDCVFSVCAGKKNCTEVEEDLVAC